MIHIYTKHITPRVRYAISLLLEQIYTTTYQLYDDKKTYRQVTGAKINYSADRTLEGVWIHPNGILNEEEINDFTPEVASYRSTKVLFPDERGTLPFDVFSAAFYLVSRYEEYLPFKKDHYGRFEADQSLAYHHDFLRVPVVNHYARHVMEALYEMYDFKSQTVPLYLFDMTFDIDNAYAFLGKSVVKKAGSMTKKILHGELGLLQDQVRTLTGKNDPYDTYDYIKEVLAKYGHTPRFFMLMSREGGVDRAINYQSKRGKQLISFLEKFGEVGLHPSYSSNDDPKRLSNEKRQLEKLLQSRVTSSRQHFLKLSIPETYRTLQKAGFKDDFTMGYATQPGFRASIAAPFRFFDLKENRQTDLIVHPFVAMDSTYRHYQKASVEIAIKDVKELIESIKKVDGYCSFLFHNESLSDWNQWKGWREFFERTVEMATYE